MKTRVRLVTHVHLQGEDVSGVVGLHFLHQGALLSKGRVIDGHKGVGRKVSRIEAPGEAIPPRGRRGEGGHAGGRRDEATAPSLAQLPGDDHSSLRVAIKPPALRDGSARVAEGRSGGPVGAHCSIGRWSFGSGRWGGRVRMAAERPVKPEYCAEQPAATQDQEQAADHQQAFVERPGRPTQQVGILLHFLNSTRKSH